MFVSPETALTGYCCGGSFEIPSFVRYNKQFLEEIIVPEVPEGMVAIIGFVDVKGTKKNGRPDITNSAAIIQGGKGIIHIYDKILLANDDHHEDVKYFTPGQEAGVIEVKIDGQIRKIQVAICEDWWTQDHDRDLIAEGVAQGAEIAFGLNYSYFYTDKQPRRYSIFGGHAKEKRIPVVSVNAAGVGDIIKNILIYDGGSLAFDCEGTPVAELKRFARDYQIIELDVDKPTTNPIQPKFYNCWEDEVIDALIFERTELFNVLGIKEAQIHLSGGLDSSIEAVLTYLALGPERIAFISNPSQCNTDSRGLVNHLAEMLAVNVTWEPIQGPYEAMVANFREVYGHDPSPLQRSTMQAVGRSVLGLTAANGQTRRGICPTGNETENVQGWANFHDIGSIGVDQQLGSLSKLELYKIATRLNQRLEKEVIPHLLYDGTIKPAAELPDAKEDPIDYFIESGICSEIARRMKGPVELMHAYDTRALTPDYFPCDDQGRTIYDLYGREQFESIVMTVFERSRRSVYKIGQSAPIVVVKDPRARGFSERPTIINHFTGRYDFDKIRARYEQGQTS